LFGVSYMVFIFKNLIWSSSMKIGSEGMAGRKARWEYYYVYLVRGNGTQTKIELSAEQFRRVVRACVALYWLEHGGYFGLEVDTPYLVKRIIKYSDFLYIITGAIYGDLIRPYFVIRTSYRWRNMGKYYDFDEINAELYITREDFFEKLFKVVLRGVDPIKNLHELREIIR